jgi:hypothetical protein
MLIFYSYIHKVFDFGLQAIEVVLLLNEVMRLDGDNLFLFATEVVFV